MSLHFYLYRAEEGLPAVNRWDRLHAEPLGTQADVRAALDALFPRLEWESVGGALHGSVRGAQDPYIDILLGEQTPGRCHFVVLNKPPPSVMRRIMARLGLNYACVPEAGNLVDPHAYGDDDRHYAVRNDPTGSTP